MPSIFNNIKSNYIGPLVPFPHSLIYDITMSCNLHCRMCVYKGYKKAEVPFKELQPGFEKIIGRIDRVYIIGAEPFMKNDLSDAIGWFRDKKINVGIQSNGTIDPNNILNKVDRYDTSLDGLESAHDAIRGTGAFKKTMRSIEKALTKGNMGVVSVVVMEENIDAVIPLVKFLQGLNIKHIDISPVIRYLRREQQAMAALGFDLAQLAMPDGDYTPSFTGGFDALLKELRSFPSVTVSPPYLGKNTKPFFKGQKRHFPSCGACYSLRVDPDGNIIHCAFIRKPLGNIIADDPVQLWETSLLDFRKHLYQAGLYPVCAKCCKRSFVF